MIDISNALSALRRAHQASVVGLPHVRVYPALQRMAPRASGAQSVQMLSACTIKALYIYEPVWSQKQASGRGHADASPCVKTKHEMQ